ncbi:TerB family tellurite resistance protein [uncultured Polaribacter sp.]|uniref:TerB family tellurite resistance protein n=1 Tax=uncultured Polaribacter sp. TaxID=174711 RepID=UPI0026041ABD|nr:TerB family tellurite resistance protein [uncultured Polaribacter sp.]
MGNFTKWIGAGLGFTLGGPIGAAIGFAIGSFVDGFSEKDLVLEQSEYQEKERTSNTKVNTQSGDFEISLLVLASIVIKADGKIDQKEQDFVRQKFLEMYGKQRANNAFKLFKGIAKKNISSRQVCIQIREHMSHAARLQLLHFLFGIAHAYNFVTSKEVEEIKKIAGYLYINQRDFESIKAMFYDASENAYKILEITKTATNDEVKKAYRKMVKKYHPDRVIDLGPEHIEGAKLKFQKVQSAYEKIKNERAM